MIVYCDRAHKRRVIAQLTQGHGDQITKEGTWSEALPPMTVRGRRIAEEASSAPDWDARSDVDKIRERILLEGRHKRPQVLQYVHELPDNVPPEELQTIDGLTLVASRSKVNLRCRVCGDDLPMRGERLEPVLDALAAAGLVEVSLQTLRDAAARFGQQA